MKKVISFSLWGNDSKYTIGAIRNAELALQLYPEFECWFYIHEETVPKDIIESLSSIRNTKIILRGGDLNTCKPMMWRFEPIDDPEVEIMLSRDTDTRILMREVFAVNEWLESGKLFHIMRDHPHHGTKILGGMFGTKKNCKIPCWNELMKHCIQNYHRNYDQEFLTNYIYPIIKNDSMIHASFFNYEGDECKPFSIDFDNDFHFVGEYVFADESRPNENIQQLREALKR